MNLDEAITDLNLEHAYRLRQVQGKDFNDWHEELDHWVGSANYGPALTVLDQIREKSHQLVQYDPREPDPYWFELTCRILTRTDPARAAEPLREWLDAWNQRSGRVRDRARISARHQKLLARFGSPETA